MACLDSGTIQKFNSQGQLLHQFSVGFSYLSGTIAVDGSGNIWVANYNGNSVHKFANDGTPISVTFDHAFNGPAAVVITPEGILYIAQYRATPHLHAFTQVGGFPTISGMVAFSELNGNLLMEPKYIGTNLLIRVWEQNKAWSGTQTANSEFLVAETNVPNLAQCPIVFANLTGVKLRTGATYDLGVSATPYNDWKVLPVTIPPNGQTNVDITITREDVRKTRFGRQQRTNTFRFDPNMNEEARDAVRYAMSVWERTGLVVFEPAPPMMTANMHFRWGDVFPANGYFEALNGTVTFDDWSAWWMPWTNREVLVRGDGLWGAKQDALLTYLLSGVATHEIGHALGLRLNCFTWLPYPHWFECTGSTLDSSGQQFGVMSYAGQPGWLGYSDVLSLKMKITGSWLTVRTDCPVDIILAFPDGRIVSKATNNVPGASYVEEDINGDGSLDDIITLTEPVSGDYTITVVREVGADPAQPVTLTVEDGEKQTVLLNAVPISGLPTNGVPVHVDRDPPQLNVKASPGVVTGADGRMVPVSVAVQVSDEDTNVVVALLDVVSSDGPDTNAVQGAEMGTNDSSFQVQAAAAGLKRVYTIVYVASDSSGNASQATTDVVVLAQPGGVFVEAAQFDPTNGITLRVFGEPGRPGAIEACPDLSGWTEIGALSLVEGRAVFTDTASVTNASRYYRAVLK